MSDEHKAVLDYLMELPVKNLRTKGMMSKKGKRIHCVKILKMLNPNMTLGEAWSTIKVYFPMEHD